MLIRFFSFSKKIGGGGVGFERSYNYQGKFQIFEKVKVIICMGCGRKRRRRSKLKIEFMKSRGPLFVGNVWGCEDNSLFLC